MHLRGTMSAKILKIFSGERAYLKAAAVIAAGGLISKLLGALYRIPLTNILGSEGMGIYQMVYPLYCILLTVSSSGLPAGIARLVSSGGAGAERRALRLYGFVGAAGGAAMFMLSDPLASLQGEPCLALCCKLLSPAVFFVSVISVVRGYFQGRHDMFPTAFTEVCEQLLKVLAGVAFALYFNDDMYLATAFTLLAVTVSEAFSALFAAILYRGERKLFRPLYREKGVRLGDILKFTVPVTVTAVAMPVSQLAESIVAVHFLRALSEGATSLYGLFSGCAMTVINLPVSVAYGLAAAGIPKISPLAAAGREEEARAAAVKMAVMTLAVGIPSAVGLYVFAPLAVNVIFRSLGAAQGALLIKLIRVMSVNAATLSLVQTASACLTALGAPLRATAVQWATCILRVLLTALFIKYTSLSVLGAAIAANIAYFVAAALNVWYIIQNGKRRPRMPRLPRRGKTDSENDYENNTHRPRRAGR